MNESCLPSTRGYSDQPQGEVCPPVQTGGGRSLLSVGIYGIFNQSNGKAYIGQSRDIKKRWRDHKRALRNGEHHSGHLQNAWNSCGEPAFSFVVIEQCPESALSDRETHWVSHYRSTDREYGYNVRDAGANGRVSAESRAKMRIAQSNRSPEWRAKMALSQRNRSPEWRKNMSLAKLGKHLSPEHRKKLSEIGKGRKFAPFSEEHKRRLSLAAKKLDHSRLRELAKAQRGIKRGPLSDAARAKIAAWHTGRLSSVETRAKISAANKGRIPSAETRAKISAAGMGNKYRLGIPHTQAIKDIISRAGMGRIKSEEERRKLSVAMMGNQNWKRKR